MAPKKIMLLCAALVITAGTGIVAKSWIASQATPVASAPVEIKPKGVLVLVAQSDVPTGSFVQENHLRWQLWPDDDIPESYLTKESVEIEDLLGSVVRRGFVTGEPINAKRLIKPGDRGFLAAVLRPGYRAVAIKVNATSGIGGLVFPGDLIDLILTQKVKGGGSEEEGEVKATSQASETILTSVRVLALDQIVDSTDEQPRVAKNATLEVTPKQAEILAVAEALGSISLSLRSLAKDEEELERIARNQDDPMADPEPERGQTYTWEAEASKVRQQKGRSVSVARGSKVKETSF